MLQVYLLSHGGLERVVPDALQVGRLAAGAAAADEQVAAVLEEQRGELRDRCPSRSRRCARRSVASAAGVRPRSRDTRRNSALVIGEVVVRAACRRVLPRSVWRELRGSALAGSAARSRKFSKLVAATRRIVDGVGAGDSDGSPRLPVELCRPEWPRPAARLRSATPSASTWPLQDEVVGCSDGGGVSPCAGWSAGRGG